MNLKEAMKKAKETGKVQTVTEPSTVMEVKVSINMRLDSHILEAIRKEAEAEGIGYQTKINSILTLHVNQKQNVETRVDALENVVKQLAALGGVEVEIGAFSLVELKEKPKKSGGAKVYVGEVLKKKNKRQPEL